MNSSFVVCSTVQNVCSLPVAAREWDGLMALLHRTRAYLNNKTKGAGKGNEK
jgi:hypothetical protein